MITINADPLAQTRYEREIARLDDDMKRTYANISEGLEAGIWTQAQADRLRETMAELKAGAIRMLKAISLS